MPKTRADLIREAGNVLAIVPNGGEMAAEDYAYLDGLVRPVIDDLRNRRVYDFASWTEFEDGPFLWLSYVLAAHAGPRFGVTPAMLAANGVTRSGAEAALRATRFVGGTGEVAAGSYF